MVAFQYDKKKKGRMTMNQNWKDMTPVQKAGFVIICLGAILMLASILKPDLFPVNMTTPAITVITVGEAMNYWEKSKKWTWMFIGAAVISVACFLLEICVL